MAQNTLRQTIAQPKSAPKTRPRVRSRANAMAPARWTAQEIALVMMMGFLVAVAMGFVVFTSWKTNQVNMQMQVTQNQISQTQQNIENVQDDINSQTSKENLAKVAAQYGLIQSDSRVKNINNN
ncbi:MAG TPA: cell division protein FtsL [Lactobacillaceae bacterium]|jgi:cell division protein FtsL